MKGLAFAAGFNSTGRHDATGAFQPEAKAFCRLHKLAGPLLFDNRQKYPVRRAFVYHALEECQTGALDVVALFCHGWIDGVQTGHVRAVAQDFARRLARVASPRLVLVLYACDSGRDADRDRKDDDDAGPGGDGGFADVMRDALLNAGVLEPRVFAHATLGHTTRNPYVRVFDNTQGTIGGQWVVEPHSPQWRAWVRALDKTSLRFRFPFMSRQEVEAELSLLR